MRDIFCFEMKELKGGKRIKSKRRWRRRRRRWKKNGKIIDKSINSFEIMRPTRTV